MKIKKISWDSDFFDFNIAELRLHPRRSDFRYLDKYVTQNRIRLIQCCIKTTDTLSVNALGHHGFEFVDLRTTFVLKGKVRPDRSQFRSIREANVDDIPVLKQMAGKVFFKISRFNHKNFDKRKSRQLYQVWVEKAVRGEYDDVCYVKEERGKIIGFVTYKKRKDRGVIGLIGIDSSYRGRGVGSALLAKCFDRSARDGNNIIEVSTGGNNIPALNFYIKNGFNIAMVQSWYYKWIDHK